MTPILLYAGLALAAAALLAFVLLVVVPPAPRVPLERRRAPGATTKSTLTKVTDRTVEAIDRVLKRQGKTTLFGAAQLEQAGIRLTPSAFVLMTVSAATVLAAVGLLVSGVTPWSLLVAPLFAAFAPAGARALIAVRTARRRARFADQLDDSLALLAGGLRAGHSLLRAVDAVSHEAEPPTSEEFARIVNETRIGRDLGDALDITAVRMRSEDFRWVAQAIAINREVGGNLSDVLDQVGRTIRERNQIRRQVKALSAEGRLSAVVLILLPIAVFGFLLATQPAYFSGLLTNPIGIIALAVAVVLLIGGSLWMMAAVRVKF